MSDQGPKNKALTPAEKRQARLEQELRANLQRRKGQARARREEPAVPKGNATEPSEG